ncbi:ribosome biogenesis GTPase YlqF [Methylomarinum vadi]|uniref:ribosome biogenesis GTPase YlqF n=1 Tax=Methylomarinum vadi TaxID=438855 RepID=UPI0004DF4408|nr:ribosome biogenesis GTPase YlqF [Methylomarinum vadi]
MQIQWYPGHMHKANQEIKQTLPQIDLIIEVLDARIPFSSQNPMLSTLRGDKPCIRVLNKNDLADPERTKEWQDYLEREHGVKTLAVTTHQPDKVKQIIELCGKMLPSKSAAHKVIHTMIVGIPNVGKSTIINILVGRVIAKTGNEPAVTKRQQRINLPGNIVLSDTPGVLWPNVENKHSGYRLAATGAIKDTAISHDDVAFYTAEYLLENYSRLLLDRFQLERLPTSEIELMEMIGKKRGCLRAGKQVDLDKTAKILLTELRSGALGRITLETPAMMAAELIELAAIRERKAAKKAARKRKWKEKN